MSDWKQGSLTVDILCSEFWESWFLDFFPSFPLAKSNDFLHEGIWISGMSTTGTITVYHLFCFREQAGRSISVLLITHILHDQGDEHTDYSNLMFVINFNHCQIHFLNPTLCEWGIILLLVQIHKLRYRGIKLVQSWSVIVPEFELRPVWLHSLSTTTLGTNWAPRSDLIWIYILL